MSFSPPLARADMRTTQYEYRSLSPLLHFTPTPNGAGSAAPTPSHGPILTACTSRGKSFVLRKCVFGLRLLAEPAPADVQVRYGDVVDDVDDDDDDGAKLS